MSSTQGDPGATEFSVTASEEQEETVHELRENGACAPIEIIRVAVSDKLIVITEHTVHMQDFLQ